VKLTVQQQALSDALGFAGRAVPSRTTMPILGNYLLRAAGRSLTVTGTDLSTHISASASMMAAGEDEPAELTVQAKQFSDLIGTLSGEVTLEHDGKRLRVAAGAAKASFPTITADEYPLVNVPEDTLDIAGLPAALDKVAFSASEDSSHPVLTGVLFELIDGELTLAAADGFRLAIVTIPLECWGDRDQNRRWIVPKRPCLTVANSGYGKFLGANPSFAHSERAVAFIGERGNVGSQLIDGSFPNVRQIIPASVVTRVVVNRQAMLDAVKRAAIFARDAANIVVLDIQGQVMTVKADSSESGDGSTRVEVDAEGGELEIAFNAGFLIEALGAATTDEVVLGFNKASTPVLMTETGDGTWKHVVMPTHLGKR
jgi:DNA polymerase III subunit beta